MAKVTNILAGDGYRGDISDIISTTTKEEKKKLREKFYKDLIDNAVAVPVGIAEGAVGLPGDIEGLARGAYRAYNAEDGDRLEAFGSAFADTTLPSTQQIQDFTNEYLLDNEFGDMVKRGKYGRLAGEFVAPASVVTAPTKTLAKGAGALSDSQFFQKLANPLDVDVQPSIFIGPKAKTYPHEVAKKVEKLEKEGKSPKDIWNTIYKEEGELPYRTKDDVLWFERDDSLLKTNPVRASRNKTYKLDEIVQAKDNPYFAEYPVMRQDTASVKPNRTQGKSSYKPTPGYDELGDKPRYEFGIINEYGAPDPMNTYREINESVDIFKKSPRGQSYSKEVDELDTVLKQLNRDSKKLKKSSNYEADRVALNKRIDDYNIKRDKIYEKYPEVLDHKEQMEFWANRVNPKTLSRLRPDDVQVSLENFRHEGQHGIQHIEGAGHGGSGRDPEYPFLLGEQMSNANAGRGNLSMAERADRFIGEPDGTLQTFSKPDVEHIVRTRKPRFDEKETPEHLKQLFKDKFGKEDSFFDTIDTFEFTKGSGNSKGGPVSITKDISVPYQSTKKVLPPSDNPFRGPVHSRYLGGRLDNGKEVDSFLGHEDPLSYFKKPKAEPRAEKAVEYLQPKENITRTTGISPARAERLAKGEIMPGELPNHTVDKAWARSTEKPYDTTQFIRDTKGNDGDFFARLARDNSREYTGMFDVMPYSNDIHTKTRFENVGNPEFMTPHTGKFVQDITTPDGNYAKLKLGSVKGANAKSLQTKVDTAVDIANNKQRYATTEDRLDAFVDAMEKIEAENAKHVSRGKPTKVKDDAMNYLWQIHDDLQREAMLTRYNLMPQRTVTGERMFNDVPPVSDRGTGEVDWDEFMQDIAENSKGIL